MPALIFPDEAEQQSLAEVVADRRPGKARASVAASWPFLFAICGRATMRSSGEKIESRTGLTSLVIQG